MPLQVLVYVWLLIPHKNQLCVEKVLGKHFCDSIDLAFFTFHHKQLLWKMMH